MKKKKILLFISLLTVISPQGFSDSLIDEPMLKAQANQIVKQFVGQLKPKLIAAIQSGGFENAIEICSVEAPKIAHQLSIATSWDVKRVSLKPRNAALATPDTFEKNILLQFDQRQINGEPASTLQYSGIVDGKYRFIRAQSTDGLCLGCHGKRIDSSVVKLLANKYPNDLATGYLLGQVRGAFSLSKEL